MRTLCLLCLLVTTICGTALAQEGRTPQEWQEMRMDWIESIRGPFFSPDNFLEAWPSNDLPAPPRTGPRDPVPCKVLFLDDPEYPFVRRREPINPLYHNLDLFDFEIAGCEYTNKTTFFDINIANGSWNHSGGHDFSLIGGFIDNVDFNYQGALQYGGFGIANITNSEISFTNSYYGIGSSVINNTIIFSRLDNPLFTLRDSEVMNSNMILLNVELIFLSFSSIRRSILSITEAPHAYLSTLLFRDSDIRISINEEITIIDMDIINSNLEMNIEGEGTIEQLRISDSSVAINIVGAIQISDLTPINTDLSNVHIEVDSLTWGEEMAGNYYCESSPPHIRIRTEAGELEALPIPAEARPC